MKLTTCFMLFACLQVGAKGVAQKVTLNENKSSLEKVLKEIGRQTGYTFLYESRLLEKSSPVTLRVKETPLDEALNLCFKGQPLTYKIFGRTVVIKEKAIQYALLEKEALIPLANIVRGKVTNSKGELLVGVSVIVKGTITGTSTNGNGNFSIDVPDGGTLVFSYVGYITKEAPVKGQSFVNIVMEESVSAMDQVVVVGYGTVKRSSFTGSVTSVENKNLDEIPVDRVENALIGKLSGVHISTPNNKAGYAPIITVRGMGSISAGNEPLIVIDGLPGASFEGLDMNSIESIEVLKDAASTSIYGSRGSGGIVVITTKKGKIGKPQLSMNSYFGFNKPILFKDWMTGEEWANYIRKYRNREFADNGGDTTIPIFGDSRRPRGMQVNPELGPASKWTWQDIVTQTAPIQSYNLSLRGGNTNTKYFISGTLVNNEGTLRTTTYKKYNLRANLDVKVNKVIDLGLEISPMYTKQRIASYDLNSLNIGPPFLSPHRENGKYPNASDYPQFAGYTTQASPLSYLYGANNYIDRFVGLNQSYINLKFTNDLSFKSSAGVILNYTTSNYYSSGIGDPKIQTTGRVGHSLSTNLINENVFNYSHTFNGNHEFNAILGASYQKQNTQSTTVSAVNNSFSNNIIETLNSAIVNPSTTTSSKSIWGLISYFGRINYAFKEKYLLAASFRTDGSSRFGIGNKWGQFPSISGAWRVSKESFMKNASLISDLKLRGSYGATGNFNIGDFQYLGTVSNVLYSPNNKTINGLGQTSYENPTLSWEKTNGLDVGIDFSILGSRISFTFDYYDRLTKAMLYSVNIPAITGFSNAIENVGSIKNNGIDIEIKSHNTTGVFKWNTSFTFNHNHNEVVDLGGVDERINSYWSMGWLLRKGLPMFSYYGYKIIGVFQNKEQIDKTSHILGSKPGNPIVLDVNNDGEIKPEDDRIPLGNFQPKYLMGLANDFSWKDFNLSVTMQASLGAKFFNAQNHYFNGGGTARRSLANREWWSQNEPGDGMSPASGISRLFAFNSFTDYYIEDASFLNVRDITFGYRFSKLAKYAHLNSIRGYASVTNLWILKSKNNHSYNPEGYTSSGISGINSTPGLNIGSSPLSTSIILGFNISF